MFTRFKGYFGMLIVLTLMLFYVAQHLVAQDFSVAATPITPSPVSRGATGTSKITVTSSNGFNKQVNLSLSPSCPTGATCKFDPNPVTPTASGVLSTLTIVPADSTPISNDININGTSIEPVAGTPSTVRAAPLLTLSVQSASAPPAAASVTENLKNNFGFGVALGLSTNVTGANIVNNATVDVNGIVRVNTRANTAAGFMLETHYYVWPKPPSDALFEANNRQDTRSWGTGPFVAAQPGSSQIISAVGGGWMIGFRRPKGSTPSGFGLGVGYEAIPAAQVLGSEFVDGKPAPVGPPPSGATTGQPLPIRYATQDKGALLVILSITF
jgi:hypothetical protein